MPLQQRNQIERQPRSRLRSNRPQGVHAPGRQRSGRLDRNGLDAYRLWPAVGVQPEVAAGHEVPAAMVPGGGRRGHGSQEQGAVKSAASPAARRCSRPLTRTANVARAQSNKAMAAVAHHTPAGSGRNRSTRIPAATADRTIGNGW